MNHFGDPCIHCGIAHDDVPRGDCQGNASKAVPIAYKSLGVRPDKVERFLVRMSTGEVVERYAHVREHAPYYHFGHAGELGHPPRYDPSIGTES